MRSNHPLKTIAIVAGLVFLCVVLVAIFLMYYRLADTLSFSSTSPPPPSSTSTCPIEYEHYTVKGSSLFPILSPGDKVTLAKGYEDCNEIKRGDIVLYTYAGNANSLIKIVRAIPGDMWNIQETEDGFFIVVNQEPLKNSEGAFYQIPPSRIAMLSLYAKTYPIIPPDTYLLLGNDIFGSLDATRFGLVSKENIAGIITKR